MIIAEGSREIREFLAATLDDADSVEVVASCSDRKQLEAALASEGVDVLVADVRVPPSHGEDGIRIASRLRQTDPRIGVVLVGQYAEPAYVLSLLESGSARGYLLTERLSEKGELLHAVETVAAGGVVVDPKIAASLIEARAHVARSPLPRLERAERELLALIVEGKRDAAIALALGIPERVAAARVQALLERLNLHRSRDAAHRARDALAYLAEEGC